MRTADFDYDLPADRIAQRPVRRGESRLLVLGSTGPEHRSIADLPDLLLPGDLLVTNNTRVIPARLFARRLSPVPGSHDSTLAGAKVEILLVERLDDAEWLTLTRPGRKSRVGTLLALEDDQVGALTAEVTGVEPDGKRRVRFSEPIEPHLHRLGHVPLPPYIKRADQRQDSTDYQTVFASVPGAIAAPTAGLHFDHELMRRIAARGVTTAEITLHVGIGTFRPVEAERVEEHRMDSERYTIPPETAKAIEETRSRDGRIVAVGTTVVRTLEGATLRDGLPLQPGSGRTELFITPGFDFKVADLMLTNFHLPRSTLLMLVSAFAGRDAVLGAYEAAVREGYRFYSYGDAMLLERRKP